MPNFSGWEIIIIILLLLLVFGAAKLPQIASSVGQSMKVFKKEVHELREDDPDNKPPASSYDATAGGQVPPVSTPNQNTQPSAPPFPPGHIDQPGGAGPAADPRQ